MTCLETIGGRKAVRNLWEALPKEKRANLISREDGNVLQALGKFEALCIMHEAETRDWHWMLTGEAPDPIKEDGADPDEWEEHAGFLLSKNGFRVIFKKRSIIDRERRADLSANGIKYEIKNPTGNGALCVHNQIKKNLYGSGRQAILNPQSSHVIISNIRSGLSFNELLVQAKTVLEGKTRFSEHELACISEIIILDRDGQMYRIYKRAEQHSRTPPGAYSAQ